MSNLRPIEPAEMIDLIQHPRFSSLDSEGDGWKVWFYDDEREHLEAADYVFKHVDYVYGDTLDDVMQEWAEVVREYKEGVR